MSSLALPKSLHQKLATEYRFAANHMAESEDLPTKLYFLSAFFGETQRVFNLHWDPTLALVHSTFQIAYQSLSARLAEVASGADRVVGIPPELPAALTKVGEDMASLFEDKQGVAHDRLLMILARLAELAYLTNGNGRYLMIKGMIKL